MHPEAGEESQRENSPLKKKKKRKKKTKKKDDTNRFVTRTTVRTRRQSLIHKKKKKKRNGECREKRTYLLKEQIFSKDYNHVTATPKGSSREGKGGEVPGDLDLITRRGLKCKR